MKKFTTENTKGTEKKMQKARRMERKTQRRLEQRACNRAVSWPFVFYASVPFFLFFVSSFFLCALCVLCGDYLFPFHTPFASELA